MVIVEEAVCARCRFLKQIDKDLDEYRAPETDDE
jgi:hypothetical protein